MGEYTTALEAPVLSVLEDIPVKGNKFLVYNQKYLVSIYE